MNLVSQTLINNNNKKKLSKRSLLDNCSEVVQREKRLKKSGFLWMAINASAIYMKHKVNVITNDFEPFTSL